MKILGFLSLGFALIGCASQTVVVERPVPREPAAVEILDVFDIEALKIYTGMGYVTNQAFRNLVPLSYLQKYLDFSVARTCGALVKNKVSYLDQVLVYPVDHLEAKDRKLQILVNRALLRLPPYPGTFYRGNRRCGVGRDDRGRFKAAFIERAFMSTSENKSSAERFTYGRNESVEPGQQVGCLMTIEGSSGRRIYDLTGNYNGEAEILFPLDRAFRLLGAPQTAGERTNVAYKELDPVFEKDVIEHLKLETYYDALKIEYANLVGTAAAKNPRKAAAEKQRLSELAERACSDAEKFFSTDPKLRAKIDKESPIYDLTDKKLNPDDYAAPD